MTEPRSSDTRRQLVEEAIRALDTLTPAGLLSAVGVKEIARRAGVGASTVYHHFGSLEGFADAVVARVFDAGTFPVDQITAHVHEITSHAFPSSAAKALHHAEYERVTTDPEFRVRLGLWSFGGPEVNEIYGAFLREIDVALAEYASQMFAAWGREVRPPFDLPAYVAAHSAMLLGASARALADPGSLSREQFSGLASGFGLIVGRLIGDRRTIDDRLAELNLAPLRRPKDHDPGGERARTRERILDAAAVALAEQQGDPPTITDIARIAGVAPSTIYAQFDGLPDLAVHLLRADAAELPAPQPVRDAREVLAAITGELRLIAAFLHRRTHLLAAYGARLIAGNLPPDSPPIDRLTATLATARSHGSLRSDFEPSQAAEMLLTLLVGRLSATPGSDPGALADDVAALLLPGLQSSAAAPRG